MAKYGKIEVLTGMYQECPVCHHNLTLRPMPDLGEAHWFCGECGTEWRVGDLITAMNEDEEE